MIDRTSTIFNILRAGVSGKLWPTFDKIPPELRSLRLQCLAEDFLTAFRDAACEAFRIELGTEVEVNAGRRVPHGYYVVGAHYVPTGGRTAMLTLQPLGAVPGKMGGPVVARVGVESVRILPDYRREFGKWAFDSARHAWAEFGPGLFKRGWDTLATGMMSDRIEESGVIGFDGWDAAGVPAGEFAAALRAVRADELWFAPPVPTRAVMLWNLECRDVSVNRPTTPHYVPEPAGGSAGASGGM